MKTIPLPFPKWQTFFFPTGRDQMRLVFGNRREIPAKPLTQNFLFEEVSSTNENQRQGETER